VRSRSNGESEMRPEERPKMKFAVSGTGDVYKNVSITCLLDTARRHSVDYIEVWLPKNFEVEGLEKSIALIRSSGIRVCALSTWTHLFLTEGIEPQQALLIQAISVAEQIGAPLVNTYFGHGKGLDDERAIDIYARNIEPCLKEAAARGITICLENEFDVLGDDPDCSDITRRPESIRVLMEKVDSPHFRVTFDACNFYFAGAEPYPYAYEALKDYIGYVHMKDGTRFRSPIPGRENPLVFTDHSGQYFCVPVGQGVINHQCLLSRLKADGYEGFFTVEPHVEQDQLADCHEQSLAYLRRELDSKGA